MSYNFGFGITTLQVWGAGGGGNPPVNSVAPVVSGSVSQGSTLTSTTGTWTNTPTSYNYQWYSGGNPVGTNQNTYVSQVTDVGNTIDCVVTAYNGSGSSAPQASNTVGPITGTGPVNTVAPAVTGTTVVGDVLTTTNGTWTGSPTGYSYQWKSGSSNVGTNVNHYTLQVSDTGNNMTCVVTATNVSGSTPATSNSVGPVTNVPINSVAPVVSGSVTVGSTLTTTNGTWTNSPTSYNYQWVNSSTGNVGTNQNTYVSQVSDVGDDISCEVTAINGVGSSTPASSNSVGPITNSSSPELDFSQSSNSMYIPVIF